jgi:hypothetical protein
MLFLSIGFAMGTDPCAYVDCGDEDWVFVAKFLSTWVNGAILLIDIVVSIPFWPRGGVRPWSRPSAARLMSLSSAALWRLRRRRGPYSAECCGPDWDRTSDLPRVRRTLSP